MEEKKDENKTKEKVRKSVGIILGILLLVVVIIIISVIKNNKRVELNKKDILTNYDSFIESKTEVNNLLETFSKKLNNNVYYNNLNEKNEEILKSFTDYSKEMCNLKEIASSLKHPCMYHYDSEDINNKCKIYNEEYVKALNSYDKKVENYNGLIKEYNSWISDKKDYEKINEVDYTC